MIDRLIEGIRRTEAPIAVGLDPVLDFVPDFMKKKIYEEMGETPEAGAEALWQFNRGITDAVCDLVPAVKIQVAMYEQLGVPGMEAYRKTTEYCKGKGLAVIGDVKRGDIGSTSAAYANAHLGRVFVGEKEYALFDSDFATVNPYLGSDGVNPFLKVCDEQDKGIFVLVKTSNPSSGEFQDRYVLDLKDGARTDHLPEREGGVSLETLLRSLGPEALTEVKVRPLYEMVGEQVAAWASNERLIGKYGYSEVGAVVGATYPAVGAVLRKIMKQSYILVPGYGAQGGKGKDLVHFFNEDGLGAIVNSSRGIIAAWKSEACAEKFRPEAYGDAARAAVIAMREDIRAALES